MMKAAQAKRILASKKPHTAECRRHELGGFDPSGNCKRCAAFLALNRALIG